VVKLLLVKKAGGIFGLGLLGLLLALFAFYWFS